MCLLNLNLHVRTFLPEINQKFKGIKKTSHQGQIVIQTLIVSLEKAIWNWMETYPREFGDLQKKPNEDLAKTCEGLFDILDSLTDSKKGRAAVWSLQMMLLILSPVCVFNYKVLKIFQKHFQF